MAARFVVTLLVTLTLLHGRCTAIFQHVTCGSVIKLANVESSDRLHSHDVKYGSGSGQQTVTGVHHADDVNSYWIVRGKYGETCQRGSPMQCGSTVRLQHLQTRHFLHSHHFKSPLSGNQEISCFGDDNYSDSGDNWMLECVSSNSDVWLRDANIRLKHQDTNKYLHIEGQKYGRPISGQKEVSAVTNTGSKNLWRAMEGVYLGADSNTV